MELRINALRRRFRSLGIANFLVTRPSNVRYLCGFTGSNGILIITGHDAYFITDGRYTNQASEQVKGAGLFIYSGGASVTDAFVRELKNNRDIRFRGRVGVESQFMTVEFYQTFRRAFPGSTPVETATVVEGLAMVKDSGEINAIRRAVDIIDRAFESVLSEIKPGVRELELSAEITYKHKRLGAEKDAFDLIVASGPRSALPHGIASSRKVRTGDLVTFDIGCIVDGYPSDMTRTVVVGKATRRQREIYRVVQEAQQLAVEGVKAGAKCAELDALARQHITRAGYGEQFTHNLGHGLGLEVHARPVLGRQSRDKLKPGMVVTVEPGVYIEGFGGVRIEDDILVTDDGAEVLNRSPKELLEL